MNIIEQDQIALAIAASLNTTNVPDHPLLKDSKGVPNIISNYFASHTTIDTKTGLGLSSSPSSSSVTFNQLLLPTDADYIHYMTYNISDFGWGCCYRCLQMILLQMHRTELNASTFSLPSITDIQHMLVQLNRMKPEKVNSTCWIEPPDCAAVLEEIYSIPTIQHTLIDIGTTTQGNESFIQFYKTLKQHFSSSLGGSNTPIICDDVTYAYVITGLAVSNTPVELTEEIKLDLEELEFKFNKGHELLHAWVLLFDPHSYESVELSDYMNGTAWKYQSKSPANKIVPGGARWVPMLPLFWKRTKWMITMPQSQAKKDTQETIQTDQTETKQTETKQTETEQTKQTEQESLTTSTNYVIAVRSKRKGSGDLHIPTKKGGITWCSGTVFQDTFNMSSSNTNTTPSLCKGTMVDILIDTDTKIVSHSLIHLSKLSEIQTKKKNNTKDGSNLYYFTYKNTTTTTRPEAICLHSLQYHGYRTAPLSQDELFNQPDDVNMHKEDKGERAVVFAKWLIETFGSRTLCNGTGVVDIAAGRGSLSAELCQQIQNLDSTLQFQTTLIEPSPRSETPVVLDAKDVATVFDEEFNSDFVQSNFINTFQHASILIGMHPDQATEAIVDAAILLNKPFAVVPCCVFPKLFPKRRLMSGQRVKSCGGFLRYLSNKHVGIETQVLGFEGRNRVLFWKGDKSVVCGHCVSQVGEEDR